LHTSVANNKERYKEMCGPWCSHLSPPLNHNMPGSSSLSKKCANALRSDESAEYHIEEKTHKSYISCLSYRSEYNYMLTCMFVSFFSSNLGFLTGKANLFKFCLHVFEMFKHLLIPSVNLHPTRPCHHQQKQIQISCDPLVRIFP
jgi:hypothetical protein